MFGPNNLKRSLNSVAQMDNYSETYSSDESETDYSVGSPSKRQRYSSYTFANCRNPCDNFEGRLFHVLTCSVCLELPLRCMFQCKNGHLFCEGCINSLLAETTVSGQVSRCGECNAIITKETILRNTAVERAVSELSIICQYCGLEYKKGNIYLHETSFCNSRPVNCRYNSIGCDWVGPFEEKAAHEKECTYPDKSGEEIYEALKRYDEEVEKLYNLYKELPNLLGGLQYNLVDLQISQNKMEDLEYVYYESRKFTISHYNFVVRARIHKCEDDHEKINAINYQIVLLSKIESPASAKYCIMKGPFSLIDFETIFYTHNFTAESNESDFHLLLLPQAYHYKGLIAAKKINFRIGMFITSK